MNRLPLVAIGTVAFLTSMLSLVFIVTNTGDRFDTVIINGRVAGEAADTITAFTIGILSGAIAVICAIRLRRHT